VKFQTGSWVTKAAWVGGG